MTQDWPELKKPPIVEAILDIDCDLPPDFDIASLDAAMKEPLKSRYPLEKSQFVIMQVVGPSPGAFSQTSQPALAALQFWSADQKQVVQLRRGGFSFTRLAPYGSLDEYLPEILRTWDLFRKIARPQLIRLIRLRYINRIMLPLKDNRVDLDEYLRAGPRLPDEEGCELAGFLIQQTARDRETGFQADYLLTREFPHASDELPIIFDNSATSNLSTEADDQEGINAIIRKLRALKDRMFFKMVTEKCLNLFQ